MDGLSIKAKHLLPKCHILPKINGVKCWLLNKKPKGISFFK